MAKPKAIWGSIFKLTSLPKSQDYGTLATSSILKPRKDFLLVYYATWR
jgi:hypothetical protein